MSKRKWTKLLIKNLTTNNEFVKIYYIPGLLFLLDFVVRVVLGVDLIDTGADMALLAVVTFITLLLEDVNPKKYSGIMVTFVLIFLSTWIVSLKIASLQNPVLFLSVDFRLIFSWFVGLTSFVFSGIIANEILLDNNKR
jgi:hypothetical protein